MSNPEFSKSEELFIVPDSLGSLVISEAIASDTKSPELLFLESGEQFVPYSREEAKLVGVTLSDLIGQHFSKSQEDSGNFSSKYISKLLKKSTSIVNDAEIYKTVLLNPTWVEKRKREEDGSLVFKVNPSIRKFRFTAHVLADYLLFNESLRAGSWPQPVDKHSPNSYDVMQAEKMTIVKAMTDQEYVDTAEKAYITLFNREQFHRKQIEEAKNRYSFVPKLLTDLKYK